MSNLAQPDQKLTAALPPAVFSRVTANAGMSRYRAVERSILAAVETGHFGPGDCLPSESQLATTFGVSIGTIRKAIDELVSANVVVRHQGRGTFVATHDADRLMFQFFHVERRDGRRDRPEVELRSFQRTRVEEDVAHALRIRPGDAVVVIENVLRLEGRPVIHDRLTICANMFRGLSERRFRDRTGTIYQFYQLEFGITVLRARERLRARLADYTSARVLGLPLHAPVVEVRRTALSFNDRPVEYRVSIVNTSSHEYVNSLSSPASTS